MLEDDKQKVTINRLYSQEVILLSLILSGSTFGLFAGYSRYLKQITKATEVPKYIFKKRWLYGRVTSVGDGDNFHFFHTPGGILGGWGWLRKVPKLPKSDNVNRFFALNNSKRKLKKNCSIFNMFSNKYTSDHFMNLEVPYKNLRNLPTLSIRICGVDAPERAHFGNPSQPFGDEALVWLSNKLIGRYVWIRPLSIDHYNRCVAKVVYWSWTGWRNVSLQMVKEGLAVVYEGKSTAEYDGEEFLYKFYERRAKAKKRGIWIQRSMETPGEYKKRMKDD